jgi:glycosyltransferase involved in cell wall biosynthesis
MVISEAMAHGLPVLTTTAAGAATLIDDRRSGLLVEPGDPDALAAALRWAAAHPDALRDMRAAAAAAARERSWASYRADVVRLVSEHLDHWRPRETAA